MTSEDMLRDILARLGVCLPFESPARIIRMYDEFLLSPTGPPFEFTMFPIDRGQGMVTVLDIEFFSLCEHHFLPFYGKAHVAYLPHERRAGFSKIPRTVDWFARRPQLQERMTAQIADFLREQLRPKGLGVITTATHLCMTMRGVQKPGTTTTLSEWRGAFLASPDIRNEFYMMMGLK